MDLQQKFILFSSSIEEMKHKQTGTQVSEHSLQDYTHPLHSQLLIWAGTGFLRGTIWKSMGSCRYAQGTCNFLFKESLSPKNLPDTSFTTISLSY